MRSCVSGGGCRPVTPGEGGACGAGRRQRGSGQAAARAAQSPGVERRGRGETYTGPLGPAQCRRRGLHGVPPPRWALAVRPALLQVTLAAGEKLQEEGAVWRGGGGWEGVLTLVAPGGWKLSGASLLCLGRATPRKPRRSPGDCGTRRCAEKGCDLDRRARLCRRPGTAQSRSRALGRGEEERVLPRKRSKKSLALLVFQQVPQRSPIAEAERDGTPGRWLSRGFLLLACLGWVWVPRSE